MYVESFDPPGRRPIYNARMEDGRERFGGPLSFWPGARRRKAVHNYINGEGPGGEPNARALQRDPAHVDLTTASRGRLVAKSDLADSNVRRRNWFGKAAP
jgi:hypothetical protein